MKVSSINKRILFVHNALQSFVRTDRDLLREKWPVIERFERKPSLRMASAIRDVMRCDLVFCWFASWHSFGPVLVAKLLHKPSVVVIGGYDTANLPEAGYGSQRGGMRRWVSRTIMWNATTLVTHSRSSQEEAIRNAYVDPNRLNVIHLGLSPLKIGSVRSRDPVILTVGQVWHENLLRKGLLPFVQSARYLPDKQFVLVGKWCDESIEILRASADKNVTFTGFLPNEDLEALYMRSSVYVQASLHEGFGLSVAEAMSAGCIPVVTRAGSLPEVVGDAGVYVESNDPLDLSQAITEALNMDEGARLKARERILTLFPIERRRQALHELVELLLRESISIPMM